MGCWKVSLLYFLLKHFTLLSSAFLLCNKHQFDPTSGMDTLANGYVRNGLRSARVICDLLISEPGASGKRFITEKPHIFYDVCRSIKSNKKIETTHISINDRYYPQSLEFSFLLYYSFSIGTICARKDQDYRFTSWPFFVSCGRTHRRLCAEVPGIRKNCMHKLTCFVNCSQTYRPAAP